MIFALLSIGASVRLAAKPWYGMVWRAYDMGITGGKMKALIIAALAVAAPAHAATAISCDTHGVHETKVSATPSPRDKTLVIDRVETYVINDVAKTFKRLNQTTGGLDDFCAECHLEFGPSQIKVTLIGNGNPKTISNYEFTLDRVAGTVSDETLYLGLDSGFSSNGKMSGICKRTAMPKIGNAKSKF